MGSDPLSDLAVLKIDASNLPVLALGDSDKVRVGDVVLAIGNPLGIGQTVTMGIISAKGRQTGLSSGNFEDFLQTDAPINQGNSGGALVSTNSELVGINSQILSPSGGSIGIGFAIPSNLAREVTGQLRQFGVARRGWIGVRIQQVTSEIAEGLGLPTTQGALVAGVTDGGPAARAGLANGDLITGFDGKPVPDDRALPRIVADTPIGKTVNMDVLRKGRKQIIKITVQKLADDAKADKPIKAPAAPVKKQPKLAELGLSLGLLDGPARAKFKIGASVQGVAVTAVEGGSSAAEKNVRPGDVIVEVAGQVVKTPDDVTKRIEADAKAGKKSILILINRSGDLTYVGLKLN